MTGYQQQIQVAVLASVLLHALMLGAYQARRSMASWTRPKTSARPAAPAAASPTATTPTITFVEAPTPARPETAPQVFMETDPRQATDQAEPGPTPFYSDQATVAANPENPSHLEGDTPYLAGTETKVLSTEDVPVPTPGAMALSQQRLTEARTQPSPGAQALIQQRLEQARAAEGLRQAEELPPQSPQLASAARPIRPGAANEPAPQALAEGATGLSFPGREIASRRAKLTASGVNRTGIAAFNVAESPFGAYDRQLIRAVQQRWYALIERFGVYERAGTVTLYFELYDDGTIRNLQRLDNTAGEILALYCEKAVTDAAPFEPLTEELRRLVGGTPREVSFTFYY